MRYKTFFIAFDVKYKPLIAHRSRRLIFMKTRSIHTKIWTDTWFESLKWDSKLLFIYFLTNEHVNLPGIYELSMKRISFESGLSEGQVKNGITTLEGKILYHGGWVIIKNVEKYDTYAGGKLQTARDNQLAGVPEEIQKIASEYRKRDTLSIGYGIGYTYPRHTRNSNSNSNSNIKGVIGGKSHEKILQAFNQLFGSNYQLTDGRKRQINLRLKVYTEEQILTAITRMSENPFYRGENRNGWKATPDYLLRNDEIIDRFINAKASGKSITDMIKEVKNN